MKRTTWILLILLILALGAYLLVTYLPEKSTSDVVEETQATTSYLIQEAEGTLISLRIINSTNHVIALGKNSEGSWQFIFPPVGIADQAKLAEVETQINALSIVLAIGRVTSPQDFGLQEPTSVIKLEYSSGISHLISIGNSSPTGSGYYVRLDGKDVFIISQYSLDAILQLADNPPYPSTPTPSPTMEIPTTTPTLDAISPTQATPETIP